MAKNEILLDKREVRQRVQQLDPGYKRCRDHRNRNHCRIRRQQLPKNNYEISHFVDASFKEFVLLLSLQ